MGGKISFVSSAANPKLDATSCFGFERVNKNVNLGPLNLTLVVASAYSALAT
jgi:hypothetical protein